MKSVAPTLAQVPAARAHRRTVVILTALDVEMRAVLDQFEHSAARVSVGGTRYEVGTYRGDSIIWKVAAAEIGEGNIGAAVEATAAIRVLQPDLIMFVGIAGSLKDEVSHGSVVVATKVYAYHGGKAGSEFLSRPMSISTDRSIEQLARKVQRSVWTDAPLPDVVIKPIAAGEAVVVSKDSDHFHLLRERFNDAVAVDMESAGMYLAAERADRVPTVAIRGISDRLDDKGPAADAEWQPIASSNAARFAFALLRAIEADDVASREAAPSTSVPRAAEILTALPPTAAAVLSDGSGPLSEAAETLSGELTAGPDHARTAELLVGPTSSLRGIEDASLWVAVGEFSVAHGAYASGAVAFKKAGDLHRAQAGRWYARAALSYAAAGEPIEAREILVAAATSGTDGAFVAIMTAAITEDPDQILAAAEGHERDDPLIELLVAQSLGAKGRIDEAIAFGRRALSQNAMQPNTGRLALALSGLLIMRDQVTDESSPQDLYDALDLALLVRDSRRAWGGSSVDASHAAAAAALRAGDPTTALRVSAPPPLGEAIEAEARDQRLIETSVTALIALGRFDEARQVAGGLTAEPARTMLLADCDIAQGAAPDRAAASIRDILPSLKAEDRFRAYLQLIHLGELELPDVSLLEDAEDRALIQAQLELKQGRSGEAIRRLRTMSSVRALSYLAAAYVETDRIADAVDVLRDGAAKFGRPRLDFQAALLLANVGRFEDASREAARTLAIAPPKSRLARDARALTIEIHSKMRDWPSVAQHASAAISDGFDEPDFRWALLWAQFSRRDVERARMTYQAAPVQPRNDDDAILLTQLLRTAPPTHTVVGQLLDLAESHLESEHVSAAAFMAVLEVSRALELSPDLSRRLQDAGESFFQTWPASQLLYRIDATDIQNVVDHLRDTLRPASGLIEDTAKKVQLGHLPYGLLAAVVGRSVAEALVKNAAGCIPIGDGNEAIVHAEEQAASAAMDRQVVCDTSAFVGCLRTDLDPARLYSAFSMVVATTATLDDAFMAADALRLRSTSNLGWNSRDERPRITEVNEDVADAWAAEAERLLTQIKGTSVRPAPEDRNERPALEALLAPIRLAKHLGLPLWSDERAVRALARSEGITAFGTLSVLRNLNTSGSVSDADVRAASVQLLRHGMVDFYVAPEDLRAIATSEGSGAQPAALFLSRPSAWENPAEALDLYRDGLNASLVGDKLLTPRDWAYAAALGAARASHAPCDLPAMTLLSGFSSLDINPTHLPGLLAGVREAASHLECDDPLPTAARLLAQSLRRTFPEGEAGQAFVRLMSQLDPDDRTTALRVFLAS